MSESSPVLRTSFTADAMGLTLNVHRWRAAASPEPRETIIILHGFLDAGGTFDAVARTLADDGFEVIAPDQRGYGRSTRVPAGGYYHFPDYVADLDALVSALDQTAVHLVGHSMGGTVACLYAGARPERITSLALLEGIGPPDLGAASAQTRMRAWLNDLDEPRLAKAMASRMDALERLARRHTAVGRERLETVVDELLTTDPTGKTWWASDPLHRTTSPFPFRAEHLQAFVRAITCPTLFVSGGASGYHPPDEAERLADFGDLARATIEGAGHMLHWSQPAQVASLLGKHAKSAAA